MEDKSESSSSDEEDDKIFTHRQWKVQNVEDVYSDDEMNQETASSLNKITKEDGSENSLSYSYSDEEDDELFGSKPFKNIKSRRC